MSIHNTAYSGKRDPINCPVNQIQPVGEQREAGCTCGDKWPCPLHSGPPEPPTDNPTTTSCSAKATEDRGEWTVKAVHEILRFPDGSEIMFATYIGADSAAKQINALINAALESAKQDFAKQIAAERDKHKTVVANFARKNVQLREQLAAEREKREMAILQYQSVIRQLREQLAAERMDRDSCVRRLEDLTTQAIELKQQLAAEREKVLELENELQAIKDAALKLALEESRNE